MFGSDLLHVQKTFQRLSELTLQSLSLQIIKLMSTWISQTIIIDLYKEAFFPDQFVCQLDNSKLSDNVCLMFAFTFTEAVV